MTPYKAQLKYRYCMAVKVEKFKDTQRQATQPPQRICEVPC